MLRAWTLVLILSSGAFAASDLGKPLDVATRSSGRPAFGVSYTYGNDPDGFAYLFTFTPKLSGHDAARSLRWNFYLKSSDTFLFDWAKDRSVSLAAVQIKLQKKNAVAIEKILRGHQGGKDGELFFVLADDSDKPVYHVSLSELCSQFPEHFSDLTNDLPCDMPKL